MEEMGVKPRGLPYLTVLDAAGTTLAAQDTHVYQSASRFDRDKVILFLKQWLPPPKAIAEETAETLVAAALKAAVKDGKGVFVSIGAEWCGWCKRLDALLANEIVGPIMRERFVLLKLDQEKVAGTKEFRAGHGSELSGGIPWYAALDATGQVVATSDAKAGNTGYPARPEEIDWFMDVIKRAAPGMDPAKAAQLEAEVRRIGQELVPN
jgi:thiol-disulfide isomerase/thioredoxin